MDTQKREDMSAMSNGTQFCKAYERATMLAVLFRKGSILGAWFLVRKPQTGELVVEYQNSAGDTWHCGSSRHDTPIPLILEWMLEHAEAGDAILFREGALWMQTGALA